MPVYSDTLGILFGNFTGHVIASRQQGCNGPRKSPREVGRNRKRSEIINKKSRCLPEDVGCTLLEVVIMTTANGMHPVFSGRHSMFSIISDLQRVNTEFAEVNTDIARS